MAKQSDFSGTRILITGHTGFSGVWLSLLLTALGAEVRGYSRDNSAFSTLFPAKQIEEGWVFRYGDVADTATLRAQLREFKPNIVFHLAAQSLVSYGYENPLETFASNTLGTASVLDACLGIEELLGVVVITTDKVYKEGPELKTESSPLEGRDPYSSSKVAAEHVVAGYRTLFKESGVVISVARGGNIIGGGDWSRNRIVPDLIRAYLDESTLSVRYPNASRPWQHVLDLVNAYVQIGHRIVSGQGQLVNTEFNVGPDPDFEYSVLDLIEEFRLKGIGVDIRVDEPRVHEASKLQISSQRSQALLGWNPRLSFSSTVGLTAEWYRMVCVDGAQAYESAKGQVMGFLLENGEQ